mgnify:CR=1 FL=1
MKVVVAYKWARNSADALVRADGSIDWRNAKMVAGEDDPAALQVGKELTGSTGGQLVGLTIGDGDASWVLARGAAETLSIDDAPFVGDNAQTAAVLAAGVARIGDVDVVVIGDSKQDPGVSVALAGHLGWPSIVGVTSAEFDAGRVVAHRRTGGNRETLAVSTPVVIGVSAEAETDVVPGMKELLAARKRPVTKVSLADLGVDVRDIPVTGVEVPEQSAARTFQGDEAPRQLLAALRAEGVL